MLAAVAMLALSCDDDGVRPDKKDIKFYMLVRDQGLPANGEVILYNLTDSLIEARFDTPPGLLSPHALAWDGESLWVGGAYSTDSLYRIDPADGTVQGVLPHIRTEGLATAATTIWYSTVSPIADSLIQISREGVRLRAITVADPVVNDLDTDNEWLYYVVNDDTDRIVRVNWNSGAAADFITNAVDGSQLYTIAVYGDFIYVIDNQTQGNTLRMFDRASGGFISDARVHVDRWITALRRVQ